jgi:hypothetical protein
MLAVTIPFVTHFSAVTAFFHQASLTSVEAGE